MSEVLLRFRGREIRVAEVAFLREWIARHPGLSRRQLSVQVCQAWHWVQANGQWRDMVCRSLLLALHRAGHICLPAKRQCPPNNALAHRRVRPVVVPDTPPITGSVKALGPLEIRWVRRTPEEALFATLLSRYHYLGYCRPVGAHLKYIVWAAERPVACAGWSSAPRQLRLRDQYVGAPAEAYAHNLHRIAYNTRYLVLPWVVVPGLASHVLARLARRLRSDWQACYGHPIDVLESFVDIERFRGTCYRAANWTCVGRSRGWGTKAKTHARTVSLKELWVYPLVDHLREHLTQ